MYADNSGPMFDFYGKPPKTERNELREWLKKLIEELDDKKF